MYTQQKCLSLPTFVYVHDLMPAASWDWVCLVFSLDGEGHARCRPPLFPLSVSLYNHILHDDDGEHFILTLGGWNQCEVGAGCKLCIVPIV